MPCGATQDGRVMMRGLTECGPLEKGMANHFSILALRTPWTAWRGKMRTGRPGVLWFLGSKRVGHDWVTELNWTELIGFSQEISFLSYWEIFYLLIFCMPFLYLYLWSCNFLFSFSPPPPPSFSSLSPFFSSLWCIFQFLTSAWMPSENEFRSIFTNPIFWKNLWQSDIISSLNFFNRI